jgi:hypothetical protein
MLTVLPSAAAKADPGQWTRKTSSNGWRIDPEAIATYRVEGSGASVALRKGEVAAILLHIARRWHYEIGAVDSGEGGGIAGHRADRTIRTAFESAYLSGTAIALHPTAYPIGGSEPLWPHHEAIVRDILVDCDGTVAWGGDLTPVAASHFHIVAGPGSKELARVAARLDTTRHVVVRSQTAGRVADPAAPDRQSAAARRRRR